VVNSAYFYKNNQHFLFQNRHIYRALVDEQLGIIIAQEFWKFEYWCTKEVEFVIRGDYSVSTDDNLF
jgi:hypothetical protein